MRFNYLFKSEIIEIKLTVAFKENKEKLAMISYEGKISKILDILGIKEASRML